MINRLQSGALAVPFAALPRCSLRFADQLQTFKVDPFLTIQNCVCVTKPTNPTNNTKPYQPTKPTNPTNLPNLPNQPTYQASPLAVRLFCKDCGAFVGMDYKVFVWTI